MSHFTVGVVIKNKTGLVDALAPYNEQDPDFYERVPYIDKDEAVRRYREEYHNTDDTDEHIWRTIIPGLYDVTDEDLEEGMIYDLYNPNAKWDWYEVGGRWCNMLKIPKRAESYRGSHYGRAEDEKPQKGRYRYVDGARIKDICWADMNKPSKETIKSMSEFWDGYVLNQNPNKDYGFCFKRDYYLNRYDSKEDYIMKESLFATHDLLLCPEDSYPEWITQGDMGWFGCDASTKDSYNEYLRRFYDIIQDPQYQDYWFIVVDCHI